MDAVLTPLNLLVNVAPSTVSYICQLLKFDAIREVNKSIGYAFDYFKGSLPGSIGYIMSATFYLTKYFGVGKYMCEASGYAYYVIYYADYLN